MIQIAEVFGPTLQGEGPYAGEVVSFVRFMRCGMNCSFCDTKATWNPKVPIPDSYNIKSLYTPQDIKDFIEENKNAILPYAGCYNHHVVISGGEPLMYENFENNLLVYFLNTLHTLGANRITIETTTLSEPKYDMENFTFSTKMKWFYEHLAKLCGSEIIFSISPKFPTSCYPKHANVTLENIWSYYSDFKNMKQFNSQWYYKFVYSKKFEKYFLNIIDKMNDELRRENCWFMPLTPNKWGEKDIEIYKRNCVDAGEFCKRYKVNYSPRIHVDLWGLKTGV